MTMDQHGPKKLVASRQLFPKVEGEEDLNSRMIREEMREDQEEFKRKYNYDPIEDKPIPGKYVYTFDEEKSILIGRPNNVLNGDAIIETSETDNEKDHKDNFKTPKKDNSQESNENGLDMNKRMD